MFASRTGWHLTPNRFSMAVRERRERNLPVLDLTESNPTHCGFAFETEAVLGALGDPLSLFYEPDPKGLLSAREAVCTYYADRGVQVDPECVFLTASTSEAYSHLFRLLANPGERILAPQPSYPLFDYLGDLSDVEIVPYPLVYHEGWQIDLHTLGQQLDPPTRAILAVHPNNPTGSFVRKHEREFLIDCCRKHGLALIADEVFADYALSEGDDRAASHAGVSEVLNFTLSGLSKIAALPQMKLAWIIANGPPDDLAEALARLEVITDTFLSVSTPVALALPKWLGMRQGIQSQVRERLLHNLEKLDSLLTPEVPLSRLHVEGGWYAVLKLPATRSDEEWAIELISREGVMVHPGHFYDFPSQGFLVVSLLPAREVFELGIRKIVNYVCNGS